MLRLIAALVAALTLASPAFAHENAEHSLGWTLGPEVLVPLLLALLLYGAGLLRLRRRSSRGRGALGKQAWTYLAGWTILAGALVSPLHQGGEASFTLHMIEHELIMLPAALLLVAARPGPVLLWGLPAGARGAVAGAARWGMWRTLGSPIFATAAQAVVLVLWHMPALFDRALRSEGWHIAQHLSFVLSALAFWWAMLRHRRGAAAYLLSAVCLFVTSMVGGGLGALMALDTSPWYLGYAQHGGSALGLSPAEDQQLAGVIMWVPGGAFHLVAALVALARALRSAPERLDYRVPGGRDAA